MKNTDYKHGSFKSGKNQIVIGSDTKEEAILKFLEKCDAGTAAAINRGVSREAIMMEIDIKKKQAEYGKDPVKEVKATPKKRKAKAK